MPKIHPAADIFPRMTGPAFDALVESIRENGQQEPVVFWQGQLIDGRNRLAACEVLGIEATDWEIDDDADPVAYSINANLHRRHLSESQRSIVAAKIATLKNGEVGNGREVGVSIDTPTRADAADLLNVSTASVSRAKSIIKDGSQSLVDAVSSGEISVNQAANLVKAVPDKREQSKLVKQGKAAIKEAVSETPKPKSSIKLPAKPTPSDVATVDAWCEQQDERPSFERFRALWESTDDIGRAAIRAFVLESTP